jgi:hypothetical protein
MVNNEQKKLYSPGCIVNNNQMELYIPVRKENKNKWSCIPLGVRKKQTNEALFPWVYGQ